ncbi:MAG: exodeoxyribonuclease [Pseudomonadota bacterium]|jgi:exodeoxyribonuclease-3
MRIATYNVNGIKARLPRLIEWLGETRPDIVCLQELKSSDETLPIADVEAAGYRGVWHGQKGFNGVAILSRSEPPVLTQQGLAGEPEDEHSRYIEADVEGVRVASIYLPNGNPQPGPKFDFKLRWMERLRLRARDLLALEIPVIMAGDYNVIPTDRDIANPANMADDALTQPESRAAFRRMLSDGWTDALEARHPGGRLWTYWDYQAGGWQRDAGFRIDHLLLSPEAADRLREAGVDKDHRGREKASDHAATWVDLNAASS